jgi:hypothetical protein
LIRFESVGNPRAHRVPTFAQRRLHISREIQNFLDSDRSLVEEIRADFSDFAMGEWIRVALHLDHVDCFLARLEPSAEEIWEIRIYDVEPQPRFFGRFAEQDSFVALTGPFSKSRIFRSRVNHERIKRACAAEWRGLFKHSPLSAGDEIKCLPLKQR